MLYILLLIIYRLEVKMSTSGQAISDAIRSHLNDTWAWVVTSWMECFLDAVGNGVYDEMKKLEDTDHACLFNTNPVGASTHF